jgi:hypothetical protein
MRRPVPLTILDDIAVRRERVNLGEARHAGTVDFDYEVERALAMGHDVPPWSCRGYLLALTMQR